MKYSSNLTYKNFVSFIIFIALSLFCIGTPCKSWEWLNPTPTGSDLNSIYFIDSYNGYAVGDNGSIIRTTDGFSSWNEIETETSNDFYGVYFINILSGTAVGESGTIFVTSDAGNSWSAAASPTTATLRAVFFTDTSTGYAVGDAVVIKTTDGGAGWSLLTSPTSSVLMSVYFTDANTGWIAGASGELYKTSDGGTSWTSENSGVGASINSIHFETSQIGYACTSSGGIIKTINGGTNWTSQSSGTTQSLNSIIFTDASNGYAGGGSGTVLKTTDGGTTWTSLTPGTTNNINALIFKTTSTGFAVGTAGEIIKTSDSGSTWSDKRTLITDETLNSLFYSNSMMGWAVGNSGTIIKTATGGESWAAETSGTSEALYSVFFTGVFTGYVVGASGTILKTTTGGLSWSGLTSPVSKDFRSVVFPSESVGYAVGQNGAAIKTVDSGDTWTTLTTGVANILYSISCLDSETCYAVGTIGKCIKTTDGGATWSSKTTGTTNTLYSVNFVNSSVGFIAGGRGTILKTTDGGETWSIYSTGTTYDLYSIGFYDELKGYASGAGGMMYATTDGGDTWEIDYSHTDGDLKNIVWGDYKSAFSVGSDGTIIAEYGDEDASSPVITDNQTGDDVWRGTNDGIYDVDFSDTGGSHINKFQVRACSTNSNCGDLIDWTDVETGIKSDSYITDWAVPEAVWDALQEGKNYISARVYDYAGLYVVKDAVFYIGIDSTPPSDVPAVRDGLGGDAAYATSPGVLSANWSDASDLQSGIAHYWYAIGTTSGDHDILDWTDNGTATSVVYTGVQPVNGVTYYFSVTAENSAGLMSSSVTDSNGQIYEGTPPVFTGGVIDGIGTDIDYSTDTTTMSAEWSAAEDPETGVSGYLFAIGTTAGATDVVTWTDAGLMTSASKSGLSLAEGQKYYFAVEAVNGAGGISEAIVTDGVIIDTTQPEVVAGLYDGDKLLADMDYASSTSSLSANWTAAVDNESGIAGYVYAIGTTPGGTDITGWSEIGNVNYITKSGLSLTDGSTYYFSVKAINNVDMMSEAAVSDGQTIDVTSPDTPSYIYDGLGIDINYASDTSALSANWAEASDSQSGIEGYLYAIGTSAGATDVVDWTDNGNATSSTRTGMSLTNGEQYYFSVMAVNGGGGLSDPVNSDGQIVDYTAPSTSAYVHDGTGDDLTYSTSTSVLSANWSGSVDGESGIVAYWYAVGTSAGATDVVDWTSNATGTAFTKTGLTLENGKKYYVAVKAENGAGLFSDEVNSNGAVVDSTAPSTVAVVHDGTDSDVQYTASSVQLSANWSESGDPQSGVAAYWYAIGTSAGATDTVNWTSNGLSTSVTHSGLTLVDGSAYYFSVKSQNGAGLFSSVKSSNGQTVDITPPNPVTGLTATPGNNTVSLTWTNPDDTDFTGVTIVRKSSGFPEDASDGDLRYEGETISFVDEGVDNNTVVYYSVFAYDHLKLYAAATSSAQVSVIPYAAGFYLRSGWNLAGISGQGAALDPSLVFDTSEYEIVGADMDDGYAYYSPSTGTVNLGFTKGYWFYSEDDIGTIDVGATDYTDASYTISLTVGWNLIANPYSDLIDWGAGNVAITCGGTATNILPLYYYDNISDTYNKITPDSDDKMVPWVGYWLYTGSENCNLTITK